MKDMSDFVEIQLAVKPFSVNQYYMNARKKFIITKAGREWKAKIQEEIKKLGLKPTQDIIHLTVNAYWSDYRRRDIDNVLKPLLDALKGSLYVDDSQIDELHVYKHQRQDEDGIIVSYTKANEID
jgi:crossover junction endodeoxyribonuclease RusA